jgi:hypothetical protein
MVIALVLIVVAPLLAVDSNVSASPSATPFAIASISIEGTNLVLKAEVPPGMEQVVLEIRASLDADWEERGAASVQEGGGVVAFTIPKPARAMAFFRLKGKPILQNATSLSAELQYVTMPSLGATVNEAGEAIFHFKGFVDGSDKIVIDREGALWRHLNWNWPDDAVTINGIQWNPREKNFLTTVGASAFLPERFSIEAVSLEIIEGRDVVALERSANAVIVYLDDTPAASGEYEFKIHFQPVMRKPAISRSAVGARLKIAAEIDGSDCLKLTVTEATWEHKAWSFPSGVTLNGIQWSPEEANVLKNEGTNTFLPPGVDLSTARIVGRKGRDLATMWADKEAVWVWFADNPNGRDLYELEIAFGP